MKNKKILDGTSDITQDPSAKLSLWTIAAVSLVSVIYFIATLYWQFDFPV